MFYNMPIYPILVLGIWNNNSKTKCNNKIVEHKLIVKARKSLSFIGIFIEKDTWQWKPTWIIDFFYNIIAAHLLVPIIF